MLKNLQFSVDYHGLITVNMDMPRRGLFEQAAQPFFVSSVIGAAIEGISEESEHG